jgi:hypothetical protein
MNHKGVRYELLPTTDPAGWKWVAHLSATKQAMGFSFSKELAEHAAKRAIEKTIKVEEKK